VAFLRHTERASRQAHEVGAAEYENLDVGSLKLSGCHKIFIRLLTLL